MNKILTEEGLQVFDSHVRSTINHFIVDHGFAPDTSQLSKLMDCGEKEIRESLQRLEDNHGLVLYPGSSEIWMVHPFAFLPTNYWVASEKGSWWANCAWCALGVAALLDSDSRITSRFGGEETSLFIEIKKNKIAETNFDDGLLHISVPIAQWWDNVHYTCSTVHFFRSEEEIERWCKNHNFQKGAILGLHQAWELSKLWYGDYLQPGWKRKSMEDCQKIFSGFGLEGEFWEIKDWK